MSGSIEICRPESALQLIMQHTQHSLAQFHWSQNSCLSSPPEMDKSTMLAERLETPCSPPTASANTAGPANHRRFPENGTDQISIDKKLLFLATCGYFWEFFRNIPVCPPRFPRANITALAPSLHKVLMRLIHLEGNQMGWRIPKRKCVRMKL